MLYFRLIDELISQVVLQRNGADPDFCCRRLDINIDTLITSMQQNDTESLKKRLEESDSKRHEAEASCEQLKKELAEVCDCVLYSRTVFHLWLRCVFADHVIRFPLTLNSFDINYVHFL